MGEEWEAVGVALILAANLQRLMQHAADRHDYARATARALETYIERQGWARVGKSTIHRILKGSTPPALDTLEAIARAYDLQVWQLLAPNLDPTNPPVIPLTETEEALYRRMRTVMQDFIRAHGDKDVEGPRPGTPRADHDSPRDVGDAPSTRPRTKYDPS
jgi:transcriptional regulator with XRE-family HTH domain